MQQILGRVLHQVLRHHIKRHQEFLSEMWWQGYEICSQDSLSQTHSRSNFGDLLIMITSFIGILCVAAFGCTVIVHL